MPKPGKNEKRKDFISRCIPIVINEGTTKDPKQAAAICHSIWRKHHPGSKSEKKEEIQEALKDILTTIKDVKEIKPKQKSNPEPIPIPEPSIEEIPEPQDEIVEESEDLEVGAIIRYKGKVGKIINIKEDP